MAKRTFKDTEYPDHAELVFQTNQDGSLTVTAANRNEGSRNYERNVVTISAADRAALARWLTRAVP